MVQLVPSVIQDNISIKLRCSLNLQSTTQNEPTVYFGNVAEKKYGSCLLSQEKMPEPTN